MIARKVWILIGLAGLAHNGLRLAANVLGAPGSFFNYLQPFQPAWAPPGITFVLVILGILAFAAYIAKVEWGRDCAREENREFLASALWAIPTSLAVGSLGVLAATKGEHSYGYFVFVALPVAVGFQSAVMLRRRRPATLGQCLSIATVSVVCMGILLVAIAMEGVICVVMAAPLGIPLALVGGALGYIATRDERVQGTTTFILLIGLTPFGPSVEKAMVPRADVFTVTTSIDLPRSPEQVWRTIIEPGKPSRPSNWFFRAGVGYPMSNHLEGTGLSATRYCDFSTGKLVEPVVVWDENRELRFRVTANPPPMRELSPYHDIHPAHLDGFLVAQQGRFRLIALPNGGTRLEATSWYQHHLWPSRYWRLWSDYLIHRIHEMVLSDIRDRLRPAF